MFALAPAQIAVVPETTAVGFVYVVTTNGCEVVEQPAWFVIVTLYVPALWTLMFAVVSPVDQRYVRLLDWPVASVIVPPPSQKGMEPKGVIVASGKPQTLTSTRSEEVRQLPFETVTVRPVLALTVMDCVVAPFDQKYEA